MHRLFCWFCHEVAHFVGFVMLRLNFFKKNVVTNYIRLSVKFSDDFVSPITNSMVSVFCHMHGLFTCLCCAIS